MRPFLYGVFIKDLFVVNALNSSSAITWMIFGIMSMTIQSTVGHITRGYKRES